VGQPARHYSPHNRRLESAAPPAMYGSERVTLLAKTALVAGFGPPTVGGPSILESCFRRYRAADTANAPPRLPVYTLTFSNPPSAKPGWVCMEHGDTVKVCVPGYKPKSYSMSAQREAEFDITFKVYPNGRASGYLDRLQLGEAMAVFGMGKKRRAPSVGGCIGLVAFGVGITEILPMAAIELAKQDDSRVTLLWQSKTWDDIFWPEQIKALETEYPDRFRFVTMLSREEREGCLQGRLDPETLRAVFDREWGLDGDDAAARAQVKWLSVGTKEMMCAFDRMVASNGYPMPRHALLQQR